jgi:hypothetical protein
VAEEIIQNAISAAARSSVSQYEQGFVELTYSVDVLSMRNQFAVADLDPEVYGYHRDDRRLRRGLLPRSPASNQ